MLIRSKVIVYCVDFIHLQYLIISYTQYDTVYTLYVKYTQYRYFYLFFVLKGSSRKRPRLEKGQESMDTDIKKEDDLKSEPKGKKITYEHVSISYVCM